MKVFALLLLVALIALPFTGFGQACVLLVKTIAATNPVALVMPAMFVIGMAALIVAALVTEE